MSAPTEGTARGGRRPAQPVGRPAAQPVGHPAAQPVGRPAGQPVGRSAAQRAGRTVVTSPRTRAAVPRPRPRYPVTREIDEQTGLGEAYMRSLILAQFRLALFVCTALGCVVGGLPLLFLLAPELREVELLGVPLPWALLAGLIYPGFVACGRWYVRQAERNERDFAELVDRN